MEYITDGSTGSVKITGGIISSISGGNKANYAYGINNYGNIVMTGGTINSHSLYYHSYGIYNRNKGITEITGGTVNCINGEDWDCYGIYNDNTGTTIIGTKADGVVSQDNPCIIGKNNRTSTNYVGYGIYNKSGIFCFYDGIIQGTTKAVYDTITEREENTELKYNTTETILTLSTTITPLAEIEGITYTSLQEAINSSETQQTTIKLLRNVTYTMNDSTITVPNTKNIILDLNGYKIVSSILEKTVQNEGRLEITDTSEDRTGTIVTSGEKFITNKEGAKLTISAGIIENRTKYVIYNEGEVVLESGEIEGINYGIYNLDNGIVKINGGIINCIDDENKDTYGIYNSGDGNVEISGGTINSFTSRYALNCYGIYNAEQGYVKMTGGEINSITSMRMGDDMSYGIYNEKSGIVEVVRGNINSSCGTERGCSYGIYNNNKGTVILGKIGDGIVSIESPSITSKTTMGSSMAYGIYNLNGILQYNDGIVKGEDKAINGTINEIEDLTEIKLTTETLDSKECEVIFLESKETNIAEVSGVEYDSIQEAVEVCGTTESTIKILRDSNPGATVIIEEDQNITLDLNGFTTNMYQPITNNGTLKIVDTSTGQAGEIVSLTGIAVSNKGTMEVQSGSIADSGYGIQNTGTLNITGGNIQNNSYGIYNDANGTVNVTGGNISLNTYGIYNYGSSATSNMTGGAIASNDYGIYNSGGTTNIISSGITSNAYGVYVAEGTTNIKEGAEVQSNTGVYVASGKLNIGETGSMNLSTPIITGEKYGLSVGILGTVYMYDGQIRGKTGATQGYITYTENGYQVATKTEGEYFVDYLALAGTISTVAEVNGISFSNLQSAINSIVGEEPRTVKLTNGIISDIAFTVAERQNVILDMNGKTITSDLDITINNAGNLTIIDSSGKNVAKISSTVGTAIVNSGTLTLGQDDGTVTQELITIEGTIYGIQNTGTLNFYDGTINGASAINGTITNRATGYIIRTTTVNGKERYYLAV